MTCHACETDTHRCPGCGEPVAHGMPACNPCNDYVTYWSELTPAERQAENDSIARHVGEAGAR